MFIDSHAHLDDERFDEDRDKLISELKANNIDLVINPGADMDSSTKAVDLAQRYDMIYAAVGVHPHDVKDMTEDMLEEIRRLTMNNKVVAIGEIGLDYYYDNSPRDLQRKWFKAQIRLAKELDLPIIIHERDAKQDMYEILKSEADGKLTGVLHCYSGHSEMAREYIDMDFYISLAGPVTFKKAKTPKEVAKDISLDYLLIETDSPYLTPEPYRGKRNEPGYVSYVAKTIAELKGVSVEEVAARTAENTKRLFRIE